MQELDEILQEVQVRASYPFRSRVHVPSLWKDAIALAVKHNTDDDSTQMWSELMAHERLLRITVCINERAIDAWITGLEEIYGNYQ